MRNEPGVRFFRILVLIGFSGGGCIPRLNGPDDNALSMLEGMHVAGAPVSPSKTKISRFLVVSTATHDGNFANDLTLSGTTWNAKADDFCNANLPGAVVGTGIYRALLNETTNRTGTSGSQLNWPLRAGVYYYDQDGTTLLSIANVNNLFDIPLTNNFPLGGNYWTGSGNSTTWAIGNTCSSWANAGSSGDFGIGTYPNASFFLQGTSACSFLKSILCVQDVVDTGLGAVSSTTQNLTWMKCAFGETWDAGTNSCLGSPVHHQFCTLQDNHCNGGTNSGILNGVDSQIYNDCASLTVASRSWRVPTATELAGFDVIYQERPALFPTQQSAYYWGNAGYFGDPTLATAYSFSSHWGAVSYKDDSGSTFLRCVSDGL